MSEDQFEKLARLIKETADETRNEIADIRAAMVTQVDYHSLGQELRDNFRSLHDEVADIRGQLDALDVKVTNVTGFRKEIDHALERIARIEKHLSLKSKAAA